MSSSSLKLDQHLCFAFYSTSRAFTKAYSTILKDLELTYPQYLTMLVLWESDGRSIREIAERLELEGATLTPLINRLTKRGLISKRQSTTDERRKDIFVTRKGQQLKAIAEEVPERIRCTVDLSDKDIQKLMDDIGTLRNAMLEVD